ncbi:glycosyltransferase [Saccharibacillus sp. CPCC 101409]|uniref:glycosyltransferase n=1 Tax=Saccharibacillus sp. CPCC 101409 TaxID=3058041 RepID=UPI002672069A|nr:glycosyltransferase [Saccharibacillus sp. CPCC 101409]MDO3411677.1 glycosyltransferase [Saccharibacillus sp. CPCC 101409]
MNIMFASHTYMGSPFVVGSHHLSREMEKLGHSVIHVSTPLSPFHLLKWKDRDIQARFRILQGKKVDTSAVVNSVPMSLLPWEIAGPIFKRTHKNWMLPSIKKVMREGGMESVDLLLIDQPRFVGLEKLVSPRVTIYRPTDIYSKMTGDASIASAEQTLMSVVDGLVSTSGPVLSELQEYNPAVPTLLLENGVEYDHFSAPVEEPDDLKPIPGPRAVYVGALDERLDLKGLKLLAEQLPEVSLVIIGPVNDETKRDFAQFANVHFLGAKKYATVPGYLQHSDIALLPLSNHAANAGRSPMKLYEYAAAGLPVVVTETPELLRRQERFLHFYRGSEDLPRTVKAALETNPDRIAIRDMAKKHAWETKVNTLLDFIDNL